ncbi:MAG TPA: XRE family transcriptional regulator [Pirellulales bacterium]|jgi:Zn-dependent peptidase ImmA (M78 family)/DNA-binding XRE family transcriptional regulator|nr:XRE family transcriptional regulator [Pirellulales bacterium]
MPSFNSIDPRILGQRIAEARKARGKTQEEVADFLGYSRPTYIAIEKGERVTKPEDIIKLAGFLGRKVHDLVRPTEPVIDLQPHLRAVAEKMKGADEQALNAGIDELQRLAEDYRDLERLMNAPLRFNYPSEVTLNPRLDPTELAEDVAKQERQRLGFGDQPIIHLRSMLEWGVGLRLFYGELPSTIAGMYAYTADLGCCILVNRKHPAERRRVSMLHEYGHLLVDRFKPGIDYLAMPGRKPANERFAEAFALCFLMPATSVRQRFHDIVNTTNDFQVADLRRLSHFYFVSVEAMALRLEQLNLITKGSWQFLKESKFAPRQAAEMLGLLPQPINDQPFPERYRYLAVNAFVRGDIGDTDLAALLRCDIITAREIVAKALVSREVSEATGEERDVQLDFQRSLLGEAAQ